MQKVIGDAAQDTNSEVQFIEHMHQASDHPIGSAFPEGYYLKGLVARVW